MEQVKKNIEKLYKMRREAFTLESEIQKELLIHAEESREFEEGEIVKVFEVHRNKEIGKGVVARVRTSVFTGGSFPSDVDGFDKNVNIISYEIFALKKDGKPSSKHMFQHPHFISSKDQARYDYYITKLDE